MTANKHTPDWSVLGPELLDAIEQAAYHLYAIGYPADEHGRYAKGGEWTFKEACPDPSDCREVERAISVLREAAAKATGGAA